MEIDIVRGLSLPSAARPSAHARADVRAPEVGTESGHVADSQLDDFCGRGGRRRCIDGSHGFVIVSIEPRQDLTARHTGLCSRARGSGIRVRQARAGLPNGFDRLQGHIFANRRDRDGRIG